MTRAPEKSGLAPARQKLVEVMQEFNYCVIRNLEVRGGQPVLDPPPIVERIAVFGRANQPNPARTKDTFTIKRSVAELFEEFDRKQSMSILTLVVENGLPHRMTVAEKIRA